MERMSEGGAVHPTWGPTSQGPVWNGGTRERVGPGLKGHHHIQLRVTTFTKPPPKPDKKTDTLRNPIQGAPGWLWQLST